MGKVRWRGSIFRDRHALVIADRQRYITLGLASSETPTPVLPIPSHAFSAADYPSESIKSGEWGTTTCGMSFLKMALSAMSNSKIEWILLARPAHVVARPWEAG